MQDNEPYIISKKKSVRKVYFGRIAAAVTVLCLIGIGAVMWFSRVSGRITVKAHEYWAVAVYSSDSAADAAQKSQSVVLSGGAGYAYGANPYKIIACCYESKQQAQTVGERLGGGVEYVKFACPQISVKKPKSNSELLGSMLTLPYTLFNELYDVFVKTDEKQITPQAALNAARKMSETCASSAVACAVFDSEISGFLKSEFGALEAALSELAAAESNVPQKIKYTLCKIADILSAKTSEFVNK